MSLMVYRYRLDKGLSVVREKEVTSRFDDVGG